jgi:hypothetical protein
MGELVQIARWRAQRIAATDIPVGAAPFALEEPCPGCGARRVSTMVWRLTRPEGKRIPFPRIEPHFLCRDGEVLWQEITDAPVPISDWSGILGHFEESRAE